MAINRGTRAKAKRILSSNLETAKVVFQPLNQLIVVRESDASDLVLFEDMVYKTISLLVQQMPELSELLSNPLGPVNNPVKWNAVVESRRHAKSIQFIYAGTLFLFHLGSAATIEEDEDVNFFTQVLHDVVDQHKITNLAAFAVHRIVRDKNCGDKLGKLFDKLGVRVVANGLVIDFNDAYGRMMWDLMSTLAAQERQSIVERNRLGKVAGARRGRWPHRAEYVPLGYDLKKGTLVPNDEEKGRVGQILEMMADPEMSMRQFADQLGMISVSRPGVQDLYGKDATVAAVHHPKDLYHSFMNALSLYETGIYEMSLPNPTPRATVFGGLPVHRDSPDDSGFIVLRYEFGLPVGGWQTPEIFEAIRAKEQSNRAFTNGIRARMPFSGRAPYEVNGVAYHLDTIGGNKYRLSRLEGDNIIPNEEFSSSFHAVRKVTGRETLGTVTALNLHELVVETIIHTLSGDEGVLGDTVANSLRIEASPEVRLALTINHHRRRADRAREESLRTDDKTTAAAFRRDAEREEGRIAELMEVPASTFASDALETREIQVDVGSFVELLAKIAKTDAKVPGSVLTACQRLIPEFHLYGIGEAGVLGWSAKVRIPTLDGDVLELGPITGQIASNTTTRSLATIHEPKLENLELFSTGASITEIAQYRNMVPGWTWVKVRQELRTAGFPESALSRLKSAPIPELRMLFGLIAVARAEAEVRGLIAEPEALANLLASRGLVPTNAESEWAAGTLINYYKPLSPRGAWTASNTDGQRAVDFVAAQGGSCAVDTLLEEIGPAASSPASALASVFGRYWRGHAAVLETDEDLSLGSQLLLRRDVTVRLISCPHCQAPLTLVLRATEVPRQLLCVKCRRMPTAPYRFPDSYFEVDPVLLRLPATENPGRPGKARSATSPAISRNELSDVEIAAIIADYGDKSIPIVGRSGLLAKYSIDSTLLYKIVRGRGVEPRQPFRRRSRR